MSCISPFESIESAQEYLGLLCDAITDAQQATQADKATEEKALSSRRVQALQLVAFNLDKLEKHIRQSRRILNDLRTLRRLLHQERLASVA